jgi:hypothetical protein
MSTYLLFDVENGNVSGNRDVSARQCTQQRRFTNTVVTDETIAMAIGQGEVRICEDPQPTDRNIDVVNLDVLRLASAA